MFCLSDVMSINATTMVSLQIFRSESHPNAHMQGPSKSKGGKESLSVFGLFQHLAHTPQGKMKLRQIFLRPSLNLDVIERRQAIINTLVLPANNSCLNLIVKSLKRIKNIRTVTIHLQKGTSGDTRRAVLHGGIWGHLREFSYHVLRMAEALRELKGGHLLPIVQQVSLVSDPKS